MSIPIKISVLMPVYNGAGYLRAAIDSILEQTFGDFEFVIVNDGSTDESERIILSYQDSRIVYVKNEKNSGLISSLNKGIELCRGKYVARMDSDDVSLKERLQKQLDFMEAHPEIGAVGCDYINFSAGLKKKVKAWVNPQEINAVLLFSSCLCHPALMIRKEVLAKNHLKFLTERKYVEDYDLWTRMSVFTLFTNLNEVLFKYRFHEKQVSLQFQEEQLLNSNAVRKAYLKSLGFIFDERELEVHQLIGSNKRISSESDLGDIEKWLGKLIAQNDVLKAIEKKSFNRVIGKMWLDSCGNTTLGMSAFSKFKNSPLKKYSVSGAGVLAKLAGKCLLRKSG